MPRNTNALTKKLIHYYKYKDNTSCIEGLPGCAFSCIDAVVIPVGILSAIIYTAVNEIKTSRMTDLNSSTDSVNICSEQPQAKQQYADDSVAVSRDSVQ